MLKKVPCRGVLGFEGWRKMRGASQFVLSPTRCLRSCFVVFLFTFLRSLFRLGAVRKDALLVGNAGFACENKTIFCMAQDCVKELDHSATANTVGRGVILYSSIKLREVPLHSNRQGIPMPLSAYSRCCR